MEVEVVPTGALLEADMYTVVEVLEAVAVRMHIRDPKYRDCCCNSNVGWLGHEDLMVILAPNINNIVVVIVDTRATEVWKKTYFTL